MTTMPTTVPTCTKTSTFREYGNRHGWHAETVACGLPIGHDGPHRTRLDDGSEFLWGSDHDHEGATT